MIIKKNDLPTVEQTFLYWKEIVCGDHYNKFRNFHIIVGAQTKIIKFNRY